MNHRNIRAAFSLFASLSMTAFYPALSAAANESDGCTDFYVSYYDTAGFRVGQQIIKLPGEGMVTLPQEALEVPEGYVLNEAWQTYQAPAMDTLGIDFQVVSTEPELQTAIASQQKEIANEEALMLNYRLSDGSLIDTQTFTCKHMATGGSATYPLYLNQDYFIDVPAGYRLITQPAEHYDVRLSSRKMVDLYVEPDSHAAETSDKEQIPNGQPTTVHCLYEDAAGTIIGTQDISYSQANGSIDGRTSNVILARNDLQIPAGWKLDEAWQMYYTEPGTDLMVRFQIAPVSESTELTFAGSSSDTSGAANASGRNTQPQVNGNVQTAVSLDPALSLMAAALSGTAAWQLFRRKKGKNEAGRKN